MHKVVDLIEPNLKKTEDVYAALAKIDPAFGVSGIEIQKLTTRFCASPKRWTRCLELATLLGGNVGTAGLTSPVLLAWIFKHPEFVYDFLVEIGGLTFGTDFNTQLESWGLTSTDIASKGAFVNKLKEIEKRGFKAPDDIRYVKAIYKVVQDTGMYHLL